MNMACLQMNALLIAVDVVSVHVSILLLLQVMSGNEPLATAIVMVPMTTIGCTAYTGGWNRLLTGGSRIFQEACSGLHSYTRGKES